MRKFLRITVWVLTIAGMTYLWAYMQHKYLHHRLENVVLTLNSPDSTRGFLDKEEELQKVLRVCDTSKNNEIKKIPVDSVFFMLGRNPWIIKRNVYLTLSYELLVDIEECKPVIRVYNKKGQSVYLDAEGRIFPTNKKYAPHVLIFNGNIDFPSVGNRQAHVGDSIYFKTDLPRVHALAKYILADDFASCCVRQVFYEKTRQKQYRSILFYLNNTDVCVVFGDDVDVEKKLEKMRRFFMRMQGNPEMENFSKINLNYNNQVVCTKINSYE